MEALSFRMGLRSLPGAASDSTLGRTSKGSLVALGPELLYSPEHPSGHTVASLWAFSHNHGFSLFPVPPWSWLGLEISQRPLDDSNILAGILAEPAPSQCLKQPHRSLGS